MQYYKSKYTDSVALITDSYVIKVHSKMISAYDKGDTYFKTTCQEILDTWIPCSSDDFTETYSNSLNEILKYAKI